MVLWVSSPSCGVFGQTKVGHLYPALHVHHDIRGLDVAMHDAVLVGVAERVADMRGDGDRMHGFQPPCLEEHLGDICAFHELHDDVEQPAWHLAEVEDCDHPRVHESRHEPGFIAETLGILRLVLPAARGEHLDGHQPVQRILPGLVHGPHPSLSNEFQHFVSMQRLLQGRW